MVCKLMDSRDAAPLIEHLRFTVPASWIPGCYLLLLDIGVLLSSSYCLVIAWYFYAFSTYPLYILKHTAHYCLWPGWRGSSQCIAFKWLLYLSALSAVQQNVCHAKGVFVQQYSLAISANNLQLHLYASLLAEKLQTVTILLLLQVLLLEYFRDHSASVNADSQLHL